MVYSMWYMVEYRAPLKGNIDGVPLKGFWAPLLSVNMGDRLSHGPLLGPQNTRCRSILRTQKGTNILTTTHMSEGQVSL